jgi:electron transfer flavoprotein alpha subunit
MEKSIVVIAEHFRGKLATVTFELVACALEIQRLEGFGIKFVILGDEIEALTKELAGTSEMEVLAVQDPNLSCYNGEIYKAVLGQILPELAPTYVCIAHSTQGWDFAPGLAVRLKYGCVTGVEGFFKEEGRMCFMRHVYGGKLFLDLETNADTTILTVQPGAFERKAPESRAPLTVKYKRTSCRPLDSKSLGVKSTKKECLALREADVIVSAGRGIGKQENLKIIEDLAALFPKSAVAGSRSVCDNKWLEYRQQVGLTGSKVTPKLYIAAGISGAIQHLAGMRSSGFIVAINKDPNAAIFNVADVCVVEDLTTFIPAFMETYEKSKV